MEQKVYPQNPTLDDTVKPQGEIERLYSDDDKTYLTMLQSRLETAKKQKEQPYPEFNNKTYYEYYTENEKIANTYHLDPKKNPDDVVVSAGTIEQKLDSLLSHINNLNLSAEVLAFDKENNKIAALGVALEDIIHDTNIKDGADGAGDEEKRMLRQRELLKQGTVFVQEEWCRKFETKKKLKSKEFDGKFKQDPEFYTKELQLVFEGPTRTLLYGPNVFLGDVTKFYMEEQPFIFVLIQTNYEAAKSKYGKFENWKYVQKGKVPSTDANEAKTIFDNKWRLTELQDDQVEIIMYQDKFNDEFQIVINGVLMLPIGFPLSAVSPKGGYNVVKQVYRVLSDKFAYGGAFVSSGSVKELSMLIDEMLKLFVLKTRKSITPAYVNTSGRVIDRKVLSPGRISMGINPGDLTPIASNEVQGVTAGEANMLTKFQDMIDKSTVSDQFTGQQGPSGTTATEISVMQQQARLTLGLTVTVCSLLEKKLAYLRLYNILENWFEPVDEKVKAIDEVRQLVNSYRKVTRTNANIEGEGPGERSVILQDGELPDENVIREYERMEEKQKGYPVRKIFLSPEGVKNAGVLWYIVINGKERESSPFFKMMFKDMLGDMIQLMSLGSIPNKEGLEEEFARVWGKPRNKLFASTNMNQSMAGVSGGPSAKGGPAGRANTPGMPAGMAPGGLAGGSGSEV